jgi:uncharacterized protein (DUF1015 family)
MVKFRRFQGFLANAMHISKIISPEYDTINTKEARTMADSNPFSFLRVNKPEINLPTETDPYSDVVYTTGKDMLQHFIQQEYLVRDSEKTMYIYQQITKDGQHKQQGLIGLTSIEDYE